MRMDIGRILKPQGIRGEVKVDPLTDDSSRFCVLKSVSVGNELKRIQSVRLSESDKFVYIKFVGVDDRNAAELLRGRFVSVDRASAVPLDAGEFFISDLIGASLAARYDDAEKRIGTVTAVDSFGAADVISVECADGKDMSFAFLRSLEPLFDEANKVFSVDGKKLDEVAVYED